MTGPPAWAWPRGCPTRTSRISCSSTPSGPAPPWSGTTSSGPRPEDRSAKARAVSRSSLFRADRLHSARTKIRTSLNRSGARPTGLPISGTCPRPPGRPSPPPPSVRTIRPLLCGTPCAGWPAARGTRSNWSTGRHPTAPCSGPSAASASHPGSAASRPCGHWHTSSATCCCTMIPATRPGPPPPAAPACAKPKPTRSPGSPAPATASPRPAACPTRPAGPAPTRALSPLPPSSPPGTASPQQEPESPATPAASCTATPPRSSSPAPARRAGRQPRRRPAGQRHPPAGHPVHPARRQPRTGTRRHHPPRPRRCSCLLHRPARRQLGTRLPARPRHHRRRHPALAHRLRTRRVDRPHQPPAPPRPPR